MIEKSPEGETWLQGRSVVPGIAVGTLHFLVDDSIFISKNNDHSPFSTEGEISRFSHAVSETQTELQLLFEKLMGRGFCQEANLVDAHLQMTSDPKLYREIEWVIRQGEKRADDAVSEVMEKFRLQFEKIPEAFIRQRFEDIESVCLRILSFLHSSLPKKESIPPKAILFAKTLSAPIVAEAGVSGLGAIVTTSGGAMSHTAIVAKARGIPYVTDIQGTSLRDSFSGAFVIVDGLAGIVVLRPTDATIRRYVVLKESQEAHFRGDDGALPTRGMTKDGHHIAVMANVSGVNDARQLSSHGLDGVGLYRTEYQVLERKRFPTEQEQVETYAEMVKAAGQKSVVIRVFDFGSDKNWDEVAGALPDIKQGRRAIDLLLDRSQIFLPHLRAMIRASAHGPLSILFPMISSIEELDRCLAIFHQAYEAVNEECPVKKPRVGAMIELPGLAFRTRLLSGKVDFISVGTNDLIQYSLAVDRSNSASFDPHLSYHSGLLRLLRFIVHESEEANLPLCICGEMASDPFLIPFLVGLGIKELSIAPRLAPMVKHVLRSFSMDEARHIAQTVLSFSSAQETYAFLRAQYCKIQEN